MGDEPEMESRLGADDFLNELYRRFWGLQAQRIPSMRVRNRMFFAEEITFS
jgi:hypothetical protein